MSRQLSTACGSLSDTNASNQAIFELMDHLNTWRRARLLFVTKKLRRKASAVEIDGHLVRVKEIDTLFGSLPQSMVADAAFQAKSHARALLNYERILYEMQTNNPSVKPQHHYERMHHIYAELNEPDGMEGVSVSIISPSLEHQIREHEMTGRWTSAQSCWEVQLQLKPDDPNSHLGLLRCLKNLGHHGQPVVKKHAALD
jgi:serine/threonine-protein kinase ATR